MAEVNHAKEGGHWYRKDGNPAYSVIGKNGKERPTTLRDARKLGLLPSVTSIIRCAASPGLENWKAQQVLLAALTTDRLPEETEQDYINRIIADSQEQAAKARERGTYIHAVVQGGFEGDPISDDDRIYYESAESELEKACGGKQDWICEKAFAGHLYGGKVDLHTPDFVIDIKTTDKDLEKIKTWDEHAMQLAAYSVGLSDIILQCGILYINVLTAESKLLWVGNEELERGWRCFQALLDYYYAKTGLGE
jgi:hypothetical protein